MQTDVLLRDLNVGGIRVTDNRRIEVIANGLAAYHGEQLAIDATIVSPIRANGHPISRADREEGIALAAALRRKARAYPELLRQGRCQMLVAAVEVGGRWHEEAYGFLVRMAKDKARAAPAALRTSLTNAWIRRWSGMIAFAVHDALAASLVEESPKDTVATDGAPPLLGQVVA